MHDLLLFVHKRFREQVATNKLSYERFVEDFFFDNLIQSEKNAAVLKILLTTDEHLLIPYLLEQTFSRGDAQNVIERYRHKGRSLADLQRQYCKPVRPTEAGEPQPTSDTIPTSTIEQETLHSTAKHSLCHHIEDEGIDLIAKYANEVNLFSVPVDASDILHILEGTGRKYYQVKSNVQLRLLFDCLSAKNRIKKGWMVTLCEQERLLSPNKKSRLLISSDLYQLSQVHKEHNLEYLRVWKYLEPIPTLKVENEQNQE